MSLVFSNTSSPYNGIIQRIEVEKYGPDGLGRISGNAVQLGIWTTAINLAKTDALKQIFAADGRVQFDDSNQTDHPIVYFDLVASQQDYSFVADENGNLILDIARVAILQSATDTVYKEIRQVDARGDKDSAFVANDTSITGVPYAYDRTSYGLKLIDIPSYNATNGLKVYVDRETTFYTTASTTATTGFDPRIDEYLVINPLYKDAMMNGAANAGLLRERKLELEQDIIKIYGRKGDDERKVMRPKKINYI